MSNVKISGFPVPFALPAASALNGTEAFPCDQTVSGEITTVSATISQLAAYLAGISSLSITDGTHTVSGVTDIMFAGAVVSGTSPNGVVTISASGGVTSVTGTANQIAATPTTGAVSLAFATNIIIPQAPTGITMSVGGQVSILTPLAGQSALLLSGAAGDSVLSITTNNAPAVQSSGGPFYQNGTGTSSPSVVMDASGADYGTIGNAANGQLWGLGYSSTLTTFGTAALTWSSTGSVAIPVPASGSTSLTVNGVSGSYAHVIQNTTTGSGTESYFSATNGTDTNCVLEISQVGAATKEAIFGPLTSTALKLQTGGVVAVTIGGTDGGVTVGSPTGGDEGTGTINVSGGYYVNGVAIGGSTGSFTGTYTGGTTSPTVTCFYTKVGTSVTLYVPAATATSNATSFSMSGLPAAIQPTTTKWCAAANGSFTNNGAVVVGYTEVSAGSLVFANSTIGTAGWTASGTKAWPAMTIVWDTN